MQPVLVRQLGEAIARNKRPLMDPPPPIKAQMDEIMALAKRAMQEHQRIFGPHGLDVTA